MQYITCMKTSKIFETDSFHTLIVSIALVTIIGIPKVEVFSLVVSWVYLSRKIRGRFIKTNLSSMITFNHAKTTQQGDYYGI